MSQNKKNTKALMDLLTEENLFLGEKEREMLEVMFFRFPTDRVGEIYDLYVQNKMQELQKKLKL